MVNAGVFYHQDFASHGVVILKNRVEPGFLALNPLIEAGLLKVFTPRITSEVEELLVRTHFEDHIHDVKKIGYHEVALLSAAGVIQGAEKLASGELKFAFCFVGTAGHHANYHSSWGFCYYNDVAMAVARLNRIGIKRIMVIDIDPHFGDGTRDLLGNDPDLIHINFYAEPFYDITLYEEYNDLNLNQALQNLDVCISAAGDDLFLSCLTSSLQYNWDCEFVIVIFGHDSHSEDYGNFYLSDQAYPEMARQIKKFAAHKPVLFVLSGGSNPDVARRVIPPLIEVFLDNAPGSDEE